RQREASSEDMHMSQSPANSSSSTGISGTDQDSIFSSLIATYRELNLKVRPVPESQVSAESSGTSIKGLLRHLRDDELAFAQSLKSRLSGVPIDVIDGKDAPLTGHEAEDNTVSMLISQFGTARATTLSLLKGLSHEAWNQPLDDGKSLLQHVQAVVERDAKVLNQISSLMKHE
ncbi:MAG: hypothetical protein ACR2OE_18125, partial [Thermomicrobiales bacterium]